MQRIACAPRTDWQQRVEEKGLVYHTADDGKPYWNESAYYEFNAPEIDLFEQVTMGLDKLCLQAVERIIQANRFEEFQVPPPFVDWIRRSWETDEQTIYGRFDLLYDGASPPKLIEFNAD